MNWLVPQPGLVIRYSYLWEREAREGRVEGVKDQPCAIVLVFLSGDNGAPLVRVPPITHSTPTKTADALEHDAFRLNRFAILNGWTCSFILSRSMSA